MTSPTLKGETWAVMLALAAREGIDQALKEAKDDLVFEYETAGLLVAKWSDRPKLLGITITEVLNDVVSDTWKWGHEFDADKFDAHVARLKANPDKVCGAWHTHPGPELDADKPSNQDICCATTMLSDLDKASSLQREWFVELIVTPARPLTDPLYQFRKFAVHPWFIGLPLEPGGEPRVRRGELVGDANPLRVSGSPVVDGPW